jgi:ATP-binding cassette subfamily B (MDR/TAP) protein 1
MYFSKKKYLFIDYIDICLFIVHAASFGYGITLVQSGEMSFQNVFRVFSVITFAAMTIGRSASIAPNYSKGKESAKRIFQLNKRQSKIDPDETTGITLVRIDMDSFFQENK